MQQNSKQEGKKKEPGEEAWIAVLRGKESVIKHTVPGSVTVVNAHPKQCIEYVEVYVVFHTVTVDFVLVVLKSQKVQPLYGGTTMPVLVYRS